MEFHVGHLAIHVVHYLNRYSYPFPANNACTCLKLPVWLSVDLLLKLATNRIAIKMTQLEQ